MCSTPALPRFPQRAIDRPKVTKTSHLQPSYNLRSLNIPSPPHLRNYGSSSGSASGSPSGSNSGSWLYFWFSFRFSFRFRSFWLRFTFRGPSQWVLGGSGSASGADFSSNIPNTQLQISKKKKKKLKTNTNLRHTEPTLESRSRKEKKPKSRSSMRIPKVC